MLARSDFGTTNPMPSATDCGACPDRRSRPWFSSSGAASTSSEWQGTARWFSIGPSRSSNYWYFKRNWKHSTPYEAGAHEQQLSAQLKKTDLSVHLLGEFAGREVEGRPGLCYPQAQAELAIGHETAPFIWVPQALQAESVEDDSYKKYFSQLENGQRSEGKYDFVRGTPSTITQEVLRKIEELRTRSQPDTAPAAALLDTHFKDQLHTLELSKFLLERRVLPLINPEEDDPRKNLKLEETSFSRNTSLKPTSRK